MKTEMEIKIKAKILIIRLLNNNIIFRSKINIKIIYYIIKITRKWKIVNNFRKIIKLYKSINNKYLSRNKIFFISQKTMISQQFKIKYKNRKINLSNKITKFKLMKIKNSYKTRFKITKTKS